MRVLVERSRTGPTVAVVLGLVAILAAFEIGVFRFIYPDPQPEVSASEITETDSDAQLRGDVAWAFALGIGGAALVAWGTQGLRGNRRLLAADDERLVVAVGPPGDELWSVGWNEVFSIRSTRDEEMESVWCLDIELAHDSLGPTDLVGARVDGDHIIIDAEDWDPPLDIVVGKLQLLLDRSRQ